MTAIEQAGRVLADAASSPARVILFGSSARNEATPDSDLDFLVIEREVEDRVAEGVRLRRALGTSACPSTSWSSTRNSPRAAGGCRAR